MELADLFNYLSGFMVLATIYAVFSLGLNVHWGATGLLNLGVAGFFAVGAYTAALLTTASPDVAQFEDFKFGGDLPNLLGTLNLGVDLWFLPSLTGAAVVAALVALLVGFVTLRLREDFLAITTLGIAEVIRLIFLNEKWLGNGSRGLYRIPKFLGDWVSPQNYDYLYAAVTLVVLLVLFLLVEQALKSPWGRVLRAIREDEVTAAASGKNVFRFKLQAFILGATIMGIGGALYTHGVRFIDPFTFDPLVATFIIWVMLMIGGSGNNLGAILGAFVVWGIWSGTQVLPSALQEPNLRFFLVGALMVLVILLRPNGILGETRRVVNPPPEPEGGDSPTS
ncbi:MAG: branched-chain amino acid ABC transporter permease [Dehalococcoidia bacterium]